MIPKDTVIYNAIVDMPKAARFVSMVHCNSYNGMIGKPASLETCIWTRRQCLEASPSIIMNCLAFEMTIMSQESKASIEVAFIWLLSN